MRNEPPQFQPLESRQLLSNAQSLTIITHGFELDGEEPGWITSMANQLTINASNPKLIDLNFDTAKTSLTFRGPRDLSLAPASATVVVFNWSGKSNNVTSSDSPEAEPGWREAAADFLANWLLSTGLAKAANKAHAPIHFIAHSFGTVVESETIRRLGYLGNIKVDQMTTLDPHDQDQDGIPDATHDPKVTVWSNVTFADNYFEDRAGKSSDPTDNDTFPIILPVGHPITAAANRNLTDRVPFHFSDFTTSSPHAKIHEWYYQTIDGNTEPDGFGEKSGDKWYVLNHKNVSPLKQGFALTVPANRKNLTALGMTAPTGKKTNVRASTPPSVFNGDFRFSTPDADTLDLPGYEDNDNVHAFVHADDAHGEVAQLSGTSPSREHFTHRPIYFARGRKFFAVDYDVITHGAADRLTVNFTSARETVHTFSQALPDAKTGWHTRKFAIPASLAGHMSDVTISLTDRNAGKVNSTVWVDNLRQLNR